MTKSWDFCIKYKIDVNKPSPKGKVASVAVTDEGRDFIR